MTHTTPCLATPWTQHLDVVGSELFLRYRKRLREPGISWQIWRDYPALSLPDVLVRVHAARQIVRNGDDFSALAAIRAGRWQPATRRPAGAAPRHDDPASRALVGIGCGLFVLFCVLSMSAAVAATASGAGG